MKNKREFFEEEVRFGASEIDDGQARFECEALQEAFASLRALRPALTMGMTPKELNTLLQRHGLFPDKQALVLLKEHVDKISDPKSEVAGIVLRIKSNLNRECPSSVNFLSRRALRP